MKQHLSILITLGSLFTSNCFAKLNVVTTLTDLRSITAEVGKDLINVDSIAKGTQDPHFIEAKPSFMVKASKADLVIAMGLELEVGWLPSIIQGARNPKIAAGQKGYLEVGPLLNPLEVASGAVSRAEGDVHPGGNPHMTLDPIRAGEIAVAIGKRLGELDSEHAAQYKANAENFQKMLQEKTKGWQERIFRSGVKKLVTYHRTFTYFLDRFKLDAPAVLEPKPGIPPTSSHILDVIKIMKDQKIKLVIVENYFDPTVTNKIKQSIPGIKAETVAVSVEGAPGIQTLADLYEQLVKTVESAKEDSLKTDAPLPTATPATTPHPESGKKGKGGNK